MARMLLSCLIGMASLVAHAAYPSSGVAGTSHDLSLDGPNTVTAARTVCVMCHAPHSGTIHGTQSIPMWGHTTTSQTFQMYNSTTLTGTTSAQPSGQSLVCLSCHDGTVAMGSMVNTPTDPGVTNYASAKGGVDPTTGMMIGSNRVGTDLRNEHPISITYQDNLNAMLQPANSLAGVKLYPTNLTGGTVECGSCHDPHNFGTLGSTAPFLRVTMVGSLLCRTCHRA